MDGRLRGWRRPTVLVMVKGEGVISNTISAGPFFGLGSLAAQSKLVLRYRSLRPHHHLISLYTAWHNLHYTFRYLCQWVQLQINRNLNFYFLLGFTVNSKGHPPTCVGPSLIVSPISVPISHTQTWPIHQNLFFSLPTYESKTWIMKDGSD